MDKIKNKNYDESRPEVKKKVENKIWYLKYS